jgi:hypothetical protein
LHGEIQRHVPACAVQYALLSGQGRVYMRQSRPRLCECARQDSRRVASAALVGSRLCFPVYKLGQPSTPVWRIARAMGPSRWCGNDVRHVAARSRAPPGYDRNCPVRRRTRARKARTGTCTIMLSAA